MSKRVLGQDILSLLRGLRLIAESGVELQEKNLEVIWKNSSVRAVALEIFRESAKAPKTSNATKTGNEVSKNVTETFDRITTVLKGVSAYASGTYSPPEWPQEEPKPTEAKKADTVVKSAKSEPPIVKTRVPRSEFEIKLSEKDKEILRKLDMEHRQKLKNIEQASAAACIVDEIPESKQKAALNVTPVLNQDIEETKKSEKIKDKNKIKAVPNPKSKLTLHSQSKQRTVPSSRIGRMLSFGSLAAGLGIGTAAEYARKALGFGETSETLFLSQANLDRIVDTLCKVRGAALKLGQILSIQDDSVVNPELAKALERVRKSADFMPNWQVQRVLAAELGENWKDNFLDFQEKPFAAASIGQVHLATTKDGKDVAIKIQYPGVAKGIDSDIDNLCGIMNLWNIFPKGMFLDNLMKVAKRELAWEVDYRREAECTNKFRELLKPYPEFYVPEVIDHLSTKEVFTTELLDGIPVDQCFDMSYEDRHFIGQKIMELCLLELLEFRYMQTDPNWANFLYNPKQKQIMLLDFGASRDYSKEFMDKYVQILKASCDGDRDTILNVSKELGFLTGYESKLMEDVHVDAVLILGEIFRCEGEYNFAAQDMSQRIQNLVPTMISQRLCPPPEEIYSLHRKLSGVFLLCSKLKVSVSCKDKFLYLYEKYTKSV